MKAGVTNHIKIQSIVPSYHEKRIQTANEEGNIENTSSFDEVNILMKHTLWGNDKGSKALALLLFITLPTVKGKRVTGGLAVPFALKLKKKLSL